MKLKLITLFAGTAIFALASISHAAHHEHGEEHVIVQPDDLEWQAGPKSLAPGAEFAVLEGDPTQKGAFTMRIKLPADYRISPHTHPKHERVTVIEGEMKFGMGRDFKEEEMETLGAGSYFSMAPGMAHFVGTDEEVTIQLNGQGPWEINYLDPTDDPRRVAK